MKKDKELEQLRKWLQKQDVNEVSFAVKINVPRIRAFKEGRVKDPSYTTVRKLLEYKNGTNN